MFYAVHPHACGENENEEYNEDQVLGSPPRLWGKLFDYTRIAQNGGSPPRLWGKRRKLSGRGRKTRFTPTPVGKTSLPTRYR